MIPQDVWSIVLIVVLTLVAAVFDSQGFVHSARIWEDGRLVWAEVGKAAGGFAVGITLYWIAIRYLKAVGVASAEIQTTIWFVVTIVGVAIASGAFFKWRPADQAVAVAVIVGMGWLAYRTGG
jgi:hypothetical protein